MVRTSVDHEAVLFEQMKKNKSNNIQAKIFEDEGDEDDYLPPDLLF